jgi:hypothetical protein
MAMEEISFEDLSDWELLLRFLPQQWEAWSHETGALRRTRGFTDAEHLLRTLLLYLVEGHSLKETALRVKHAAIADVSSVAIWKRLRHSGEWFRRMNMALLSAQHDANGMVELLPGRCVRAVDGTLVTEPGRTGSSWRIHYSIDLSTLRCDSVEIFEKATGETFKRFPVRPGDVLLGDRVYANRPGIGHVLSSGGDVITRLPFTNVPLVDKKGREVELLRHLRTIKGHQVKEWHWLMPCREENSIKVRVCATKKTETAATLSRKKLQRKTHGEYTPTKEALEAAGYFFVLTTLPGDMLPASGVLSAYRARWQIELVFKRLKSILGLGCLPKQEPEGARAWLQGKLLIASLVEALIAAGENFSPWGYPLDPQKPMAGDSIHV